MWSVCWEDRNFVMASEENGGPLSVNNPFGGPY